MGKAFDFGAAAKQAEKDGYLGGGGYLKLKEGTNRMRLVSEALPHPGEYQGRKTFKWLLYVLDRADGTVKPFFMPHSISKMVADLQRSDDWGFEGVPLPYDLTINAKGAGTKEVEYSVIPSPKRVPLTPEEEKAVAEAKPLAEVQAAIYEKGGTAREHETTFDPETVTAEAPSLTVVVSPVNDATKQAIGVALQAASAKEGADALRGRLLAELGRRRYASYADFLARGEKDAAAVLQFIDPSAFDPDEIPF